MDHHIVPQVYLKQFTDANKKLWSIKTRVPYKQKVKPFTTAQVGYVKDYYNTTRVDDFKFSDKGEKFIETEVNALYENRYERLLKILINKPSYISSNEAYQFIETLLSFKQRNPVFTASMDKETRLELVNERINEMIEADMIYKKIEKVLGNDKNDIFYERMRQRLSKVFEDDNIPLKIQLEGMVDTYNQKKDIIGGLLTSLVEGEWIIFESGKVPFITSDNPGFTLDANDRINNLTFDTALSFQFPLTPKHFLFIYIPLKNSLEGNRKKIRYRLLNLEFTRAMNRCSIAHSYKRIVSNDKNEMQYMLHTYFTPKTKV